jgi:hypothetical protein
MILNRERTEDKDGEFVANPSGGERTMLKRGVFT